MQAILWVVSGDLAISVGGVKQVLSTCPMGCARSLLITEYWQLFADD